ncbi:MAG: glutathione S-transferase family protein [Sphingomonas sp.]|nr:glutathione S-transferase family protein [Sphingomonas sp.]
MILYGSSMSPFVRKVLAFAGEKMVDLDVRAVGLGDQNPDFRAASPFGKMPALVDGDYSLADSSAIVHYLEARHPEPALIPADPQLRGQCIWFEEFADTILSACGAKMFFNRIVAPIFLKRPGNLEIAEAAETQELPPILDYLERVAPAGEGYLVGDRLSLADIAIASPFANLEHLGIALDEPRYLKTLVFVRRILARPSFAGWIERETRFFAKLNA